MVTLAARGEIGSSIVVFRHPTHVLLDFLINEVPDQDEDVWQAWDRI